MEEIERRFELRAPDVVRQFLSSHPGLVDLVLEVPGRVARRFGSEARIALDVRPDREGFEEPELFVCVVTGLLPEEAWPRMWEVDREWWLDAAGAEPVNLHVEFA
jgi:hypothetical protein